MNHSDDNPCYIHAEAARDKKCAYKAVITKHSYPVYMCEYLPDGDQLNYCAPASCPLTSDIDLKEKTEFA